tara:strand:+ start:150 stop:317 length:168 start_codon:yes stop_codon:yes gene_type:complete
MTDKELKAFVKAFLTLERGTSVMYTLVMELSERLNTIEEKVELLEKSILKSDEIH